MVSLLAVDSPYQEQAESIQVRKLETGHRESRCHMFKQKKTGYNRKYSKSDTKVHSHREPIDLTPTLKKRFPIADTENIIPKHKKGKYHYHLVRGVKCTTIFQNIRHKPY